MSRWEELLETSRKSGASRAVGSPYPALLVIFIGLGAIYMCWNLTATAREVPILTAAVLVVLGLFDLGTRTRMPFKSFFVKFWGADFTNLEMKFAPGLTRELVVIGWAVACALGMLFIGILPTIPIFCFAYLMIQGKRPLLESVLVTAGFFVCVYVLFEVLLHYHLYRGALFTKGGIASW